ncbi:hypothetical protein C8J57DRAFT_1535898 [Mycena rebaudengoi]|nr:hypothetical protein C8J57DRAFT_1640648 [Mycena rebaudengoi]KAJ7197898.1 hypothetical protein C8J57DRAFT_1545804 [Mycena rebaudengoi]KAJ7224001.1 hypothetical protein C8J57DRAFT_1535898 [Mycena rebaudengoi]
MDAPLSISHTAEVNGGVVSGPTFADLPDSVLLHIIRYVIYGYSLSDRHVLVAGVCRRWLRVFDRVRRSLRCYIDRLPSELLSAIFYESLGNLRDDPRMLGLRRRKLGKVCRSWRSISRRDPLLWSFIFVDNRTSTESFVWRVAQSGQSDVAFHLDLLPFHYSHRSISSYIHRILTTMAPVLPRCRSFASSSTDLISSTLLFEALAQLRCPLLTHLDIRLSPTSMLSQIAHDIPFPVPFNDDVPALTSLRWRGGIAIWQLPRLYENLDTIELEDLSFACVLSDVDLFSVFRAASKLRVLVVSNVCCYETLATVSRADKILAVLPRLTHLRIEATLAYNSLHWMSRLRAPALQVLSVDVSPRYLGVSEFIAASRHLLGSVTTLILGNSSVSHDDLAGFLSAVPKLKLLDGRTARRSFVDSMCWTAAASITLCPHIECLVFGDSLTSDDIRDIFEPRPLGSPSSAIKVYSLSPVGVDGELAVPLKTWMESDGVFRDAETDVPDLFAVRCDVGG